MKKVYRIEGMSCNHCRLHVEQTLNELEGVQASVSLDSAQATIEFAGEVLSLAQLQDALAEEGEYRISEL